MKGLLIKDLYMTAKYCRMHFVILALFLVISFFDQSTNLILVYYPCLLAGTIPVNMLSYDERSGWNVYSRVLPYTKAQIVSGKYLLGLLAQILMLLITAVVQAGRLLYHHAFDWSGYGFLMLAVCVLSFASASITMPFIFRYGVEKGRIAYYVMVGGACACTVLLSYWSPSWNAAALPQALLIIILCAAALAVYAFSWFLSVTFYQKREV